MNIGKRVKITKTPFHKKSLQEEINLVGKTATIVESREFHGSIVYVLYIDDLSERDRLKTSEILFHEHWFENLEEEPNEES